MKLKTCIPLFPQKKGNTVNVGVFILKFKFSCLISNVNGRSGSCL